jgi:hypothetical protein
MNYKARDVRVRTVSPWTPSVLIKTLRNNCVGYNTIVWGGGEEGGLVSFQAQK